jgi:hypothetical protein
MRFRDCCLHLRRRRFPSPPRRPMGLRPSFDGFLDTARRSLICRVIGSLVLSSSRLPLARNPADRHG